MSFTDRLVLWLHIGFAIFALGPVTIAVLSTPRYIRGGNPVIVGYLLRTTRIYTLVSLGVLVFGLVSAQQHKEFSKPWLTISMTLFVVALVLPIEIPRIPAPVGLRAARAHRRAHDLAGGEVDRKSVV